LGLSAYFFLFNLFLIGRGYSVTQLGILTGAMAAGNLVGALPSAIVIERKGLRNALRFCTALTPSLLCARALLPFFPLQVLLAFAGGVSLSLWAVCISPAVANTTNERERPFAFSLLFSIGIGVGALGGLAAGVVPGLLVGLSHGLQLFPPIQLTLIASCCFAALGVIPTLALPKWDSVVAVRARRHMSPALVRFLPAVAAWGLVAGSFSPFANVFFAVHLHLPLRQIGAVFSISQVAQVAAVLCAPLIFRKWGVLPSIVSAQFATATCFVLLAVGTRSAFACCVYVALTAFQWMNEPGIYSLLMKIVPEDQRSNASASMSFALSLAQLVAAGSAGWAFTHLGYPVVLSLIALVAIIAAALFHFFIRGQTGPKTVCLAEVSSGLDEGRSMAN
jgi:MFS family permease